MKMIIVSALCVLQLSACSVHHSHQASHQLSQSRHLTHRTTVHHGEHTRWKNKHTYNVKSRAYPKPHRFTHETHQHQKHYAARNRTLHREITRSHTREVHNKKTLLREKKRGFFREKSDVKQQKSCTFQIN